MRETSLQQFFGACDALIKGNFQNAETNVREVLRAVAACPALVELFGAVTADFDYAFARSKCLIDGERGERGSAFLPTDRSEVLAFVFCLLADLDKGELNMGNFLLRYFYEDGSYTASYELFTDRMIRPFRDIVRDLFPEDGSEGSLRRLQSRREEVFGILTRLSHEEKNRMDALPLRMEDKTASDVLFEELFAALRRRDAAETTAMLVGYRYFLRFINAESEGSDALFSAAREL